MAASATHPSDNQDSQAMLVSMHQLRSSDYLQDILGVKAPLWLGHVCHMLRQKGYVKGYYKSQKDPWVPYGWGVLFVF